MWDLEMFLKENKIKRENKFFAATKSIKDSSGEPALWEIRPVPTKENEEIRCSCLKKTKDGFSLDTPLYVARLVAASVVSPDLYNAKLQDSYGVVTPEDLVREMVDNHGEYAKLVAFVEEMNGCEPMDKKVEKAKN